MSGYFEAMDGQRHVVVTANPDHIELELNRNYARGEYVYLTRDEAKTLAQHLIDAATATPATGARQEDGTE